METGLKMQGMAADAATAAGSGPLLMVWCWPAASITPTCARRQMVSRGVCSSRRRSLAAGTHTKVAKGAPVVFRLQRQRQQQQKQRSDISGFRV